MFMIEHLILCVRDEVAHAVVYSNAHTKLISYSPIDGDGTYREAALDEYKARLHTLHREEVVLRALRERTTSAADKLILASVDASTPSSDSASSMSQAVKVLIELLRQVEKSGQRKQLLFQIRVIDISDAKWEKAHGEESMNFHNLTQAVLQAKRTVENMATGLRDTDDGCDKFRRLLNRT